MIIPPLVAAADIPLDLAFNIRDVLLKTLVVGLSNRPLLALELRETGLIAAGKRFRIRAFGERIEAIGDLALGIIRLFVVIPSLEHAARTILERIEPTTSSL